MNPKRMPFDIQLTYNRPVGKSAQQRQQRVRNLVARGVPIGFAIASVRGLFRGPY